MPNTQGCQQLDIALSYLPYPPPLKVLSTRHCWLHALTHYSKHHQNLGARSSALNFSCWVSLPAITDIINTCLSPALYQTTKRWPLWAYSWRSLTLVLMSLVTTIPFLFFLPKLVEHVTLDQLSKRLLHHSFSPVCQPVYHPGTAVRWCPFLIPRLPPWPISHCCQWFLFLPAFAVHHPGYSLHSIHTAPVFGHEHHDLHYLAFANDTQLNVSSSLTNCYLLTSNSQCNSDIQNWMSKLNKS